VKGDVIIVEAHHRRAAAAIATHLVPRLADLERRATISVAGESGSGKSETGLALLEALGRLGRHAVVLQQDAYFVLPPRSNDSARRRDIRQVGTDEVRLALLDAHLAAVRDGATSLRKPLVIYAEDRIEDEEIVLDGIDTVIAEGTYTSLLEAIDARVFIARNRLETIGARQRRGREAEDPFLEQVLEIEHDIIAAHLELADYVITRNYDVELPQR